MRDRMSYTCNINTTIIKHVMESVCPYKLRSVLSFRFKLHN